MPADEAPAEPPRRWRKPLAVVTLVTGALVAAGDLYVVSVTRDGLVAGVDAAPVRPFAMVLGNRVFPGGVPSRELADRLEAGLALYRAGRARRVIVSGLSRPGYDEPAAMAAWLEARGVAAADVVVDPGGYRTAASMADAAARGVRALLVVSQPYHLPRAIYLARHAGMEALGVPSVTQRRSVVEYLRVWLRETLARVETVIEVALRGVHGDLERRAG
jgi:SanA protein